MLNADLPLSAHGPASRPATQVALRTAEQVGKEKLSEASKGTVNGLCLFFRMEKINLE